MSDVVLTVLDCKECGKCCDFLGWPPFEDENEIDNITDETLREKVKQDFQNPDRVGMPCTFYQKGTIGEDGQSGNCGHYEDRPKVCREFEIGGGNCLWVRDNVELRHGN